MAVPLEGDRKPIAVVASPFAENTGAISPDGHWIAYASSDSGRSELYVQAFPPGTPPSGRWQVSNETAYEVKWRGDGKEIYYQSDAGPGKVMAVSLQTSPQGVRAEPPRVLFEADYQNGNLHQFDVTPDGQRFLLVLRPTDQNSTPLTVVSNWQAALRK